MSYLFLNCTYPSLVSGFGGQLKLINYFKSSIIEVDREFKREEIKEKLFSLGIGKNIGQTGRYLSNISQLLTKKSTPHLRQVIEFSGGRGRKIYKDLKVN